MSYAMTRRIAVLVLMGLALLALSTCGGSSADRAGGGGVVPAPAPELDPAPDPDRTAPNGCAYEGDPACGYVPEDPVPARCTPDYAGDMACQTNEGLLNDMADLNSDRINSGW
jgi:hypothetical protein